MNEQAILNVLSNMAMENTNLKLVLEETKIQNEQLKTQLVEQEKGSLEKEGE